MDGHFYHFFHMFTVFWNKKGVLLVEFMEQVQLALRTYCETLTRLRQASKIAGVGNCRREKFSSTTKLVRTPLPQPRTSFTNCFNNPLYSSGLAPSDYFLSLYFKQWLAGQRFENIDDLKSAITSWFNSETKVLKKLMHRYKKCLGMKMKFVCRKLNLWTKDF